MAQPMTPAEHARIRELHAQGTSRAGIARDIGRSAAAIGKFADREGLTWDRTKTEAATRAKQADNASRRADAIRRLYDHADRVMDRLEAPTYKATADSFGVIHVTEVPRDAAPAADVRSLASTATNALFAAAKLEQVDAGRSDGPARSMLAALGEQFAALAESEPYTDSDEA